MIGVVRPLTIRCSPRWKGAIIPVRVSWPSGKTQTTSPSSMPGPPRGTPAGSSSGPPVGEIGIARIDLRNRPMIGRSKYGA